ncbi:MAG: hypothetical protein JSR47_12970 [Proteobacteria bacterium]|nr:hypothetical protein [Pseudomonadota bacterium]
MKALRPIWIALRAAVLATAVFAVVLYIVDRSGWNGLVLWGTDLKEYTIFLVIFFLGVLTVKT